MRVCVEYRLKLNSERTLRSLLESLSPELRNLPSDCSGQIYLEKNNHLVIELECVNAGKIRALNNSFIGVLLMLLELAGEIKNG
jgi:hypothetical protein